MDHRIRSEVVISQGQFGFMKGRSTEDAIFALRQLLEKYKEGQRKIHCTFIDLEKAYNSMVYEKEKGFREVHQTGAGYVMQRQWLEAQQVLQSLSQ